MSALSIVSSQSIIHAKSVTPNRKKAIFVVLAAMAELVDALDSGSSRGNSVDVRVILAANDFYYGGMPLAPDNNHSFKAKNFSFKI